MQKLTNGYLWVVGLIWCGYGIFMFLNPGLLAQLAHMEQVSYVATVEVRSMYGGLEWGLGFFTLLGVCPAFDYRRAALMLNTVVLSALAVTRFAGILLDAPDVTQALMVPFDSSNLAAGYNASALWFFEVPFALLAWFLIIRTPKIGSRISSD